MGVLRQGAVVFAREVRKLDQRSVLLGSARQLTAHSLVIGGVRGKTTYGAIVPFGEEGLLVKERVARPGNLTSQAVEIFEQIWGFFAAVASDELEVDAVDVVRRKKRIETQLLSFADRRA